MQFHSFHIEPAFEALTDFVRSLPARFERGEGELMYRGRNEIRRYTVGGERVVVKSFGVPNVVNQVAYGALRASKAQRSCEYAALLLREGFLSPRPVGYCTVREGLLFKHSFYACLESASPYSYIDLMHQRLPHPEVYLTEIGRVAGRMHEKGMIHKDYSRGNLLLRLTEAGRPEVELIDLNRIRFHRVGLHEGCMSFRRLPATDDMLRAMAQGYAEARGADADHCFTLMRQYRLETPEEAIARDPLSV